MCTASGLFCCCRGNDNGFIFFREIKRAFQAAGRQDCHCQYQSDQTSHGLLNGLNRVKTLACLETPRQSITTYHDLFPFCCMRMFPHWIGTGHVPKQHAVSALIWIEQKWNVIDNQLIIAADNPRAQWIFHHYIVQNSFVRHFKMRRQILVSPQNASVTTPPTIHAAPITRSVVTASFNTRAPR